MSMKMLTIYQFLGAFFAYFLMTVLLPALILYRRVKSERFITRFFAYFLVGNFYLMNLVFLLELLHISCRATLIAGTAIPFLYFVVRVNHIPCKQIASDTFTAVYRISNGTLGVKNFLLHLCRKVIRGLKLTLRFCWRFVAGHITDLLLIGAFLGLLLYLYGTNILEVYGYCASDIPVHNYWINYLGKNQIFVAGVYPFGFHCIVYYLHAVFGMDTYVLLRVFCLVQTILVHIVLVAFLKGCCKSKYIPYLGGLSYLAGSWFYRGTYSRYYSSLPQEFGMLFILPAIYFAYEFFRIKKEELQGKREKKASVDCLVCFALSFSMTLSVHFYGTMIAGLFCMGIAVGFAFRFLRRQYIGRVIVTCLIGVVLAVLPMAAAYAMGTPLQGSLGWGMNVISGKSGDDAAEPETEEPTEDTGAQTTGDQETQKTEQIPEDQETQTTENQGVQQEAVTTETGELEAPENTGSTERGSITPRQQSGIGERIYKKTISVLKNMRSAFEEYVINEENAWLRQVFYMCVAVLAVFALLFFLLRQPDYGAILLSTVVYMLLMSILLASGRLGIPKLMDPSRCSIYYAYTMPIVFALALDAPLYLLLGLWKKKWTRRLMHVLSFAALSAAVCFVWTEDKIREPYIGTGLQSNAAVTCLTNIIRDNPDFTWTICSANDELRMGEDHGYHYEVITFLQQLERVGGKNLVVMPTHRVYFFIEKIPLDYTVAYEGSGQSISRRGAAQPLPAANGIRMYEGEERWILMSRMYYWAESFRQMYPNEMKVYYETDDFICYEIEQNDYRLYNFSIDYGYNIQAETEGEKADDAT